MAWKQLNLHTQTPLAETLSDILNELGAVAVTFQDDADEPVLEPAPGEMRIWSNTCVEGLFETDVNLDGVITEITRRIHPQPLPSYDIVDIEDQDWERVWLDDFKPMRFGRHLWIVPSVYDNVSEPDAVNIRLDPGLAFGTGTHPTTALCLTWLDGQSLDGKSVIDFGCGSGILAIAAAKLGAATVYATDIDPQALQATADNASENQVRHLLQIDDVESFNPKLVDILLANILANPLIELAGSFANRVKGGGALVLSGILKEQADDVLQAYAPWFEMQKPVLMDDWVMLTGTRKQRASG